MSAVVHRLDDRRPMTDDGWSCLRVYRAGQVVWWHGRPWESLVDGNAARPQVVVDGFLYVSEDWAQVWDDGRQDES